MSSRTLGMIRMRNPWQVTENHLLCTENMDIPPRHVISSQNLSTSHPLSVRVAILVSQLKINHENPPTNISALLFMLKSLSLQSSGQERCHEVTKLKSRTHAPKAHLLCDVQQVGMSSWKRFQLQRRWGRRI